jgi:hypothetical protein
MGIETILAFATLGLMDVISIVLLVVSLRYLAKMNETMNVDDRIMILQGRRAEEALRVIREELHRTD